MMMGNNQKWLQIIFAGYTECTYCSVNTSGVKFLIHSNLILIRRIQIRYHFRILAERKSMRIRETTNVDKSLQVRINYKSLQ